MQQIVALISMEMLVRNTNQIQTPNQA